MESMGMGGISSGFATMMGTFSDAQAIRVQGAYEAAQERTNAHLAGMSAVDATFAGDWEGAQVQKRGQEVAGTQLASAGRQGVTGGSMAAPIARTESASATDAMMARYNAYNKAFGFKMEQVQADTKAKLTDVATQASYYNTLANGGLKALGGGTQDYLTQTEAARRG